MEELTIYEFGIKKGKVAVSIILPTYNRGYIINKPIESIRNQSFTDYEVIIVDDHSSDNTRDIVSKYEDIPIKYIYLEENHGGGYARNIGMKHSKGKYLAFMDSDCVWDKDFLKINIEYISDNYDLTFCRYQLVELNGHTSVTPAVEYKKINTLSKLIHFELEKNVFGTPLVCMSRKIWEECGGFDEKLKRYQDWDYFFRILLTQKYRIRFIDKILMNSFQQKNSLSMQHRDIKIDSLIHIFVKNIETYKELNIIDEAIDKLCKNTEKYCNIGIVLRRVLVSYVERNLSLKNDKDMENNKIISQYIFPFHLFGEGNKIIICGPRNINRQFYWQAKQYGNIEVTAVLDYDDGIEMSMNEDEKLIDTIKSCEFDSILIADDDEIHAQKIKEKLLKKGISKERIRWDGKMYTYEEFYRNYLNMMRVICPDNI